VAYPSPQIDHRAAGFSEPPKRGTDNSPAVLATTSGDCQSTIARANGREHSGPGPLGESLAGLAGRQDGAESKRRDEREQPIFASKLNLSVFMPRSMPVPRLLLDLLDLMVHPTFLQPHNTKNQLIAQWPIVGDSIPALSVHKKALYFHDKITGKIQAER